MKIQLKNLTLINFKGVERFQANFNHITSIYGDNATGKTTVFDAFLWLFFGKNSEDVSQFEVKRLDAKNNFIKDIEAEVSATILINNQEVVAKKVLRQKWVKRRGELETNYAGDENIYFWNDVPMKEGEFKTKIKEVVEENIFKLITNPFYFNTLKWNDRRNILIALAGEITNEEVLSSLGNGQQYTTLITALNQGKSLDEYKRELAAKKKKVKDEAEGIPARIDEVGRGLPAQRNFEELKSELKKLTLEVQNVQDALDSDSRKASEENKRYTDALTEYNNMVNEHNQKKFAIQTEIQNLEFEAKTKARDLIGNAQSEIDSLNRRINEKQSELKRYNNALVMLNNEKASAEESKSELYKKFDEVSATELKFDDNQFSCPSCKREMPYDDIESKKSEITANFNQDKIKQIDGIKSKGAQINADIQVLCQRMEEGKAQIETLTAEITGLQNTLESLKSNASGPQKSFDDLVQEELDNSAAYKAKKDELTRHALIATGFKAPEPLVAEVDNELKAKRDAINENIRAIQGELAKESQITEGQKRISELRDQEAKLAQALADLEGQEYAILQFTKSKVDAIERKINGKFKFVKFKMFNQQVNGGESETCETLVNSNGSFVPFTDANNAARINSGIDIINTLCKHYDVYAPIFIDNRESVTELIESDSQIVNLFVSAADKKLRVI